MLNPSIFSKLCNYISKKPRFFVAGLGVVIVIGAIIASMSAAMYMYTQYQTNFIELCLGVKPPSNFTPIRHNAIFSKLGVLRGG